jgi:hypothetical protein
MSVQIGNVNISPGRTLKGFACSAVLASLLAQIRFFSKAPHSALRTVFDRLFTHNSLNPLGGWF